MIGVFFAGQIEKNQTIIVKAMIQTIIDIYPDLILFHSFSTDKLVKLLDIKKAKVVKIPDNKDGWDKFKNNCIELLWNLDINKLIVLKIPMFSGFRKNDQRVYDKFVKKFEEREIDDREKLNYESVRVILRKCMFIKCAADFCEIIHYVFDPNELVLSDEKRVGILKTHEMEYIPLYEPYLLVNTSLQTKTQDLFFYVTAMTNERSYILDLFKKIYEETDSIDVKVFDRTNRREIISQEEYYRKLSISKFTLILPPYDKTSFSIIRFIEGVMSNCLPLIYNNVNLHDLRCTFPDIYDIIKSENLIFDDFTNLQKKMEEIEPMREMILQKLKTTMSYQKFTNLDWCKRRWHRILGV